MHISTRIRSIEGSRTVAFTGLIERLRRDGRHIINFAVGEPAFETPASVIASTKTALDQGQTRYGPVRGQPELLEALASRFEGYCADNMLLSNGSKQSLYMIFQVICNPRDEVIIPAPCWVSFIQQVKLAGGHPVLVPTRKHQLDYDHISQAINDKTRAILINSPNNPTGAVYPRADLEKIADLAIANDLWIIADEAYDVFVFDGQTYTSMFDITTVRDRTIVVRSFSKGYSMTGFRLGFVAAPTKVVSELAKLQSHLTGNVCSFAQHGALQALALDSRLHNDWRRELQHKRDIAYDYASNLFECIKPQGAFYLFPDVSNQIQNGASAEDLATRILEQANVALVPGEAFGQSEHVRISFALAEEDLIEGFERIAKIL